MESVYLSAEYITVNGSYGGDQEWFRDDFFGNGDLIRYGGCGLIAMADTLLYLESQKTLQQSLPTLVNANKLTRSTYRLFVESLFYQYLQPWRNPLFNPKRYRSEANFVLGIQGWQLRRGLNRFLQQRQTHFYSARSGHKISERIQNQLKRNRPVPLMIGPTKEMLPKGLRFLGRSNAVRTRHISRLEHNFPPSDYEENPTAMGAHWVTITGYYQDNGREYVVVASWGERYLLDLTAYQQDRDWIGGIIVI